MSQNGISRRACGLLLSLLLCAPAAQAGLLEFLSEGAHFLSGQGGCESYQEDTARQGAQLARQRCKPEGDLTGLGRQAQDLQAIQTAVQSSASASAEDEFFAALAEQHSRELQCAGNFADLVASGNETALADIENKVRLYREAQQNVIRQARILSEDLSLPKVCPLSLAELKPSPVFEGQVDRHYEVCKSLITSRLAAQTIQSSIPMGHLPAMADLIDKMGAYKEGPELSALQVQLRSEIQKAYRSAKGQLQGEANKLQDTLRSKGGAGFGRQERYALLSDSAVVQKVLQEGGASKDLKGLACRADARYGSGADSLNRGLLVGSLAISGGAGLLLRAGGVAAKVIQGANTARSTGLLSMNAARALQISALAVDGVAAYSAIDSSCLGGNAPTLTAQTQGGACVSAPKVEQLQQDSCVLAVSLSALGFAAVVPSQQVKDLLGRMTGLGSASARAVPPPPYPGC